MTSIILNPTDISQWHSLIVEAQKTSNLRLNESLESYLVYLLNRFINQPELSNAVLAVDLLQSIDGPIEQIKLVGDKSLLLCGLFPDLAAKHCTLSYYTDIGTGAYSTVADRSTKSYAKLYNELANSFNKLQLILMATKPTYF